MEIDYAAATFWLECFVLGFTFFWGYVLWAGGAFLWMRDELARTRWGTRKVAALFRRAFGIRDRSHVASGPVNDFAGTSSAPGWMVKNR